MNGLQDVTHLLGDDEQSDSFNSLALKRKNEENTDIEMKRVFPRRRRILHYDPIREVLDFISILRLLRLASVSWFFFERYLKHRGRAARVGHVYCVLWSPLDQLKIIRNESLEECHRHCPIVPLKFFVPPDDITSINRISFLFFNSKINHFQQEIVRFLRHISPMVTENHSLCIAIPPQLPVLQILNEVGFKRFPRALLYGDSYKNVELILRLPCIQKANYIRLKDTSYSEIPVGSLAGALVEWLHFKDQNDEVENRSTLRRGLHMFLTASTKDNQNDFLHAFWRLLAEHFVASNRLCHFTVLLRRVRFPVEVAYSEVNGNQLNNPPLLLTRVKATYGDDGRDREMMEQLQMLFDDDELRKRESVCVWRGPMCNPKDIKNRIFEEKNKIPKSFNDKNVFQIYFQRQFRNDLKKETA